jgi:hypothetical protein
MKIDLQNMISLVILILALSFWMGSISDDLENISDNIETLSDSMKYSECGILGLSFNDYQD